MRELYRSFVIILILAQCAAAQFALSGRVWTPRAPGQTDMFPFTAVLTFATPAGSKGQSVAARTWETDPSGWYRVSAKAGTYSITYAGPGRFMRPVLLTNQFFAPGEVLVRNITPPADYAVLTPKGWDSNAATNYYQAFVARSTSITHVGFMLAHDGVDGGGPGWQDLAVSIHRGGDGTPDTWPQIGPTVPVLFVDTGGEKQFAFGAGWNSGQVPLEPGKTYAVHLRSEKPGGRFQCFWHDDVYPQGDCYRVGPEGKGFTGHDMWMYIAGDGDGLLVPYNKCVLREFNSLTQFAPRWSQTYVAQGRGAASVMLYAAVATSQPVLKRQQVIVRFRDGGPDGPVVGTEKIAIGQGTAGADSGVIGVSFAPGEVNLEPGKKYAVEFQSFGEHAGFNPVSKQPRDVYDEGEAYFNSQDKVDYDLDMMIVEYAHAAANWVEATVEENLLVNGNMEKGEFDPGDHDKGGPDGWKRYAIDPGTAFWYVAEQKKKGDRHVKIIGGSINGRTVDGGYVQKVEKLSRLDTYRLAGRVRCSWPVDDVHQACIGYDPTGQDADPKAATIVWTTLPNAWGVWEDYLSPPIRPASDTISVWLRGRTTFTADHTFEADFDDLALRRVRTNTPDATSSQK